MPPDQLTQRVKALRHWLMTFRALVNGLEVFLQDKTPITQQYLGVMNNCVDGMRDELHRVEQSINK